MALIVRAILLQAPLQFEFPVDWLHALGLILNVLYALSLRGYLLLLLVGFIVYATGLSDSLAKILVGMGVFIYVLGPLATNVMGSFMGFESITIESATAAWFSLFGVSDSEIVSFLLLTGELVAAVCCLVGSILYFTPTSREMGSKGKSLITRSLILALIIVFLHLTPWL